MSLFTRLKKLSHLFRTVANIKPKTKSHPSSLAEDKTLNSVTTSLEKTAASESSARELPVYVSNLFGCSSDDVQAADDEKSSKTEVDCYCVIEYSSPEGLQAGAKKVVTRERKQRFAFYSDQDFRFDKVVSQTANLLGTHGTVEVLGHLGKEIDLEECNILIKKCIKRARSACQETVVEDNMRLAFQTFRKMKESGFLVEEQTYGQLLEYLIDMGMTQEFQFFCGVIKAANPSSHSNLRYYEMILWIRVNNVKKIQEFCSDIVTYDGKDKTVLQESYLLALCESGRKEEISQFLEIMDIAKFSSQDYVASIFTCLGRFFLESLLEKFLLTYKATFEDASNFICCYVVAIPNLEVEDAISKYKSLHEKHKVTPSSASYEKLIIYCCDSLKVHVALELVDEMCELDLTFSLKALHAILHASGENCDFNLVHRMYSLIKRHKLEPNPETFRKMIYLCVKMKDYDNAYNMLSDMEQMNIKSTTAMYNSIMAGYFREKNFSAALRVLEQMKEAKVKPDSHTFSYLITNCTSEKDVDMYYKEAKQSGCHVSKHVLMALVNAYSACGQFEKAKQVVLNDPTRATKKTEGTKNEIRSVLVQSLASHGRLSDAYDTYEQIKKDGGSLEPRAIISLIENLQSHEEALSKLLPLLEELDDPNYWLEGCLRVILHCVRYKHLSAAVELLEQVRNQVCTDELSLEVIFDQVFSFVAESESLEFGLQLLHSMKNELGLSPSRKWLDFLLHACVTTKDMDSALFVWQEYQSAGLPYNTLSFLRMYQVLLALGDCHAAKVLLTKIPKDDPHVCCIIESSKMTYSKGKMIPRGIIKKEKDVLRG